MRARSSDLDIDVDDLPKMSPSGLRLLWQRVMGREAPPQMHINRLFLRELAWRIQAKRIRGLGASGGGAAAVGVGAGAITAAGVDSATERLLNAAAQRVVLEANERPAAECLFVLDHLIAVIVAQVGHAQRAVGGVELPAAGESGEAAVALEHFEGDGHVLLVNEHVAGDVAPEAAGVDGLIDRGLEFGGGVLDADGHEQVMTAAV